MNSGGSSRFEWRFGVCALLVLFYIAAGACLVSAAAATPGIKYKLHMVADGKSSVEDSEEEEPDERRMDIQAPGCLRLDSQVQWFSRPGQRP